jgi:hypothetical protein
MTPLIESLSRDIRSPDAGCDAARDSGRQWS